MNNLVLSHILATKNIYQIFKCQIVFPVLFLSPRSNVHVIYCKCVLIPMRILTHLLSLFSSVFIFSSSRSTCSLFILFLFFFCINLTVKLFYCLLSGLGFFPLFKLLYMWFQKSFIYTSLRFSEANSFETFYFVRVSIIF